MHIKRQESVGLAQSRKIGTSAQFVLIGDHVLYNLQRMKGEN